MMSRAMFALLLASVFYGGAATGFGHVLRVRVPETFAYFTGVIQGGIATEPMERNVILATSTGSHFFYDVCICWMPETYAIAQYTSIPLASRCEWHVGRYTMLQILFALWPILTRFNDKWEECYVFPNDYVGETGASVRVRHSLFTNNWMGRVVTSVRNGYAFYSCFWEVLAPPVVWGGGVLNFGAYPDMSVEAYRGPVMLLWPSCVGRGLSTTMGWMWVASLTTTIRVPQDFVRMIERIYHPFP